MKNPWRILKRKKHVHEWEFSPRGLWFCGTCFAYSAGNPHQT